MMDEPVVLTTFRDLSLSRETSVQEVKGNLSFRIPGDFISTKGLGLCCLSRETLSLSLADAFAYRPSSKTELAMNTSIIWMTTYLTGNPSFPF
jgi:hypothetical protein